ncbi:hypothetical protein EV196_101394 [Mariniflexile fucanivorans]|uniref:Uncharacterized protein n=1 Tax=Mariniflexile fucanivorans TaxID=264023 RepID=A0A4V2QEQ7_9FLAO|nr:hypothetical protein [Mariniflexile fucanivorans]TCL68967.1 hypothetical protein EV196_101394 [Mariniflexile fucanivorans]
MISAITHKITAFVLVFILFAHNINTLAIIGDFVVNQDFIAKNLCVQKENQQGCNGKCHLMKELNDSEPDSKTTIPVKETRRFSLDAFCSYDIKNLESKNIFNKAYYFSFNSYASNLIAIYFDIDTPPPIIS